MKNHDCMCDAPFGAISVGDEMPEMTLTAYDPVKGEETTIETESLKGKWQIYFFYPADFTFICPTELEEMAELYPEFQKEGAQVLSVSTDTAFVHKAWHDTSEAIKKVKFPMVADRSVELSRMFGVMIEEEGNALRGSFIVDPDGIVKAAEINDNSIGRKASELLRKLRAAKFVREHGGQVCPASWEPGDDTLKPGMDLVGKI